MWDWSSSAWEREIWPECASLTSWQVCGVGVLYLEFWILVHSNTVFVSRERTDLDTDSESVRISVDRDRFRSNERLKKLLSVQGTLTQILLSVWAKLTTIILSVQGKYLCYSASGLMAMVLAWIQYGACFKSTMILQFYTIYSTMYQYVVSIFYTDF